MGTGADSDHLAPGIHLLHDSSPLTRASLLAAHLRAELCATLPQADAAVAGRSSTPRLSPDQITDLRSLAARVARAERIAERTRERASAGLAAGLADRGVAVAVHPATVRDRARAVVAAQEELAAAERELARHDSLGATRALEAEEEAARAARAHAATAVAPDEPVGAPRSRAVGVVMVGLGLGLVLLGLRLAPLWVALVPVLGACLLALRWLAPPRETDPDLAAASSLLAEVSETTDAAFGVRRALRDADARREALALEREACLERVRVASRAWTDIAGEHADVAEVDEVIRRLDPQHEQALALAGQTTTVRATSGLLDESLGRWSATWAALGQVAPEPSSGERAVEELVSRLTRPLVLVGPATARAGDLAQVAPSAPVVVVEEAGAAGAEAVS